MVLPKLYKSSEVYPYVVLYCKSIKVKAFIMQFPLVGRLIIIFHIDGLRLSEVVRSFNSLNGEKSVSSVWEYRWIFDASIISQVRASK